jgi:hypothetical protein
MPSTHIDAFAGLTGGTSTIGRSTHHINLFGAEPIGSPLVRLSLTKGMITVDFLADPPGTGLHVPSQTTVSWSKAFRKTPHRCCHGGVYGEGPFPTSPAARQTSISRRRPARANCVAVAASSVTNVAPARSPMARTTASSSVTPPSRPTGPPPRRVVYGEGHSRPAQPHGNFDLDRA